MKDFIDYVTSNHEHISKSESLDRSSLVFAFVGDALFTLFVRSYLAEISTAKAGVLHTETTKFVRAKYQKELLDVLEEKLDDEERQIVLNARNQKTNNVAKNSNLEEYKKSTSFEALLGYLYLTHQNERLFEILEICQERIAKDL